MTDIDHKTAFFSHLTVKNFRKLRNVSLELRPLTVLIGVNGVGKTSVLDVLSLLASAARLRLRTTLLDLGGLPSITSLESSGEICLGIARKEHRALVTRYDLCVKSTALGYATSSEALIQDRPDQPEHDESITLLNSDGNWIQYSDPDQEQVTFPRFSGDSSESALAQAPRMIKRIEEFRRTLASSARYHMLNVEAGAPVRTPQQMRPATLPGANGEDLASNLYSLRESHADHFELIQDTIRGAFPSFDRFEFPPVAAGLLAMAWRDKNYKQPLYMHQLSEGMLRFIWLATLLQSPDVPALTLIDEPEVSLHPGLLRYLADLFREASNRTQLVVATHSDLLVRFLNPSEIVAMDSGEDGFTSARWADTLDLDEWLKEYSLDELWAKGLVGARE